MMTGEFAVLLAIAVVCLLVGLVGMVCAAIPAIKALRAELAATPEVWEMRFTIRETVVSWNDGTVVALPLRPARLARPALSARPLCEAA